MGKISDILTPEFMERIRERELSRILKNTRDFYTPLPQGEPPQGEIPKWQYLGTTSISSFEEGRLEGYSDASKIYDSVVENLKERIQELEKG